MEVIITANGTNYIAKITDIAQEWTSYSIGFSQFVTKDTQPVALNLSLLPTITKISLYIKNDYSEETEQGTVKRYYDDCVYMDEIYFNNSITVYTNERSAAE